MKNKCDYKQLRAFVLNTEQKGGAMKINCTSLNLSLEDGEKGFLRSLNGF